MLSKSAIETIKKYMPIIIAVVAVFALVLTILNIFNTYDVRATVKVSGEKESSTGPIKDLFEGADGEFTMAKIANILFGISNLAILAFAVLYVLDAFKIADIYSKFVAKLVKGMNPAFVIGAFGAAMAFVKILFTAMSVYKESIFGVTMKVSIGAHWTTWVALFLYAIIAVADKFLLVEPKVAE